MVHVKCDRHICMFAASASISKEVAFGQLHNSGKGAFGDRLIVVVESIVVDGGAAAHGRAYQIFDINASN